MEQNKNEEHAPFADNWGKELTKTIGLNIQHLRKRKKISAQTLSDTTQALGMKIPRAVISNLENGRRDTITVQELHVLAKALEVSSETLQGMAGIAAQVRSVDSMIHDAVTDLEEFVDVAFEFYNSIIFAEEGQAELDEISAGEVISPGLKTVYEGNQAFLEAISTENMQQHLRKILNFAESYYPQHQNMFNANEIAEKYIAQELATNSPETPTTDQE